MRSGAGCGGGGGHEGGGEEVETREGGTRWTKAGGRRRRALSEGLVVLVTRTTVAQWLQLVDQFL